MSFQWAENRGRPREQKVTPRESQHLKCMAFLRDEGLTISGDTGENNMSGISERMKESETSEGNGGDGFVGMAVLCYASSWEVM